MTSMAALTLSIRRATYALSFSPAMIAMALCSDGKAWAQGSASDSPAPQEVSVRGVHRATNPTDVTVTASEARMAAGTEGDPAKVVQDLPGVARTSFDSGQLVVWGSAPEDTRSYVDGVEIPQLFHGSALRSTVQGDLLRSVTLTPGAYGADYGRSLGGILRVETTDLPTTGLHGSLAVDTIDGSAIVTGRASDRVRAAIAGRVGWLDSILHGVNAPDVDDTISIPQYRDYQAKVQVALREHESLDVVLLGSGDDLTRTIPDPDPARARNESTSTSFQRAYVHYRRQLEDGTQLDVLPWVGHDANEGDEHFGTVPATWDQQTIRWGLRASSRSLVASPITLGFGLELDGSNAELARSGSLTNPPREGDITVFGQPPGDDTNSDTWSATIVDIAPHAQMDAELGPASLTADSALTDT